MADTDEPPPSAPPSREGIITPYFFVLKDNPLYRSLFFSNVVSLVGDWLSYIALLTIMDEMHAAPIWTALYLLARCIPSFVCSPLVGVLADRFDRRWLMIASDLTRGILALGNLLIATFPSPKLIALIPILTAVQFGFGSVFEPCRSAILPQVVPKKDLLTANALSGTTWSAMAFLGAAFGGAFTIVFGAQGAFIVDALSYAVSAGFIWRLVGAELSEEESEDSETEQDVQEEEEEEELQELTTNNNQTDTEAVVIEEEDIATKVENTLSTEPEACSDLQNEEEEELLQEQKPQDTQDNTETQKENRYSAIAGACAHYSSFIWAVLQEAWSMYFGGWGFLRVNPYILMLTFLKISSALTFSLAAAVVNFANIRFAQNVFPYGEGGSGTLGLLYAFIGIGTGLMPMLLKRVFGETTKGIHTSLTVGFGLLGTFALLVAWSPNVVCFLLFNAVRSSGAASVYTFSNAILQMKVPNLYRGRVMSWDLGLMLLANGFSVLGAAYLFSIGYSPFVVAFIAGLIGTISFFGWGVALFLTHPTSLKKPVLPHMTEKKKKKKKAAQLVPEV